LHNSGCSSNFEDNELFASKHLDIVNADSVQVEEEEIKGNLCRVHTPIREIHFH